MKVAKQNKNDVALENITVQSSKCSSIQMQRKFRNINSSSSHGTNLPARRIWNLHPNK